MKGKRYKNVTLNRANLIQFLYFESHILDRQQFENNEIQKIKQQQQD